MTPSLPSAPRRSLLAFLLAMAGGAWGGDVIDFYAPPSQVGEGAGSVVLTVTRAGSGVGAVSVAYATANLSATAGSDFTATSGTLNWASGDLAAKTITVPILDDAVFEPYEYFKVALSAPGGGATLGSTYTTIMIVDDDPNPAGTLSILSEDAGAGITVAENAGNVVITVLRSGSTTGAVSADLSFSPLTAANGVDYHVPASRTLSWGDGEGGAKTLLVPIIDDAIAKPSRSFSVSFDPNSLVGNPSTGSGTTVTIIDDDPPLAGTLTLPSAVGVVESAGNATVTVMRAGGSQGAVSVDYSTSIFSGTAIASNDYQDVAGTLTWADGDATPRTVTIPIIDDNVAEPTKRIFLFFVNPGGGLMLPDPTFNYVAVDIVDDDATAGVVGFSSDQYDVGEGAGQALLTVTRAGGSIGAISVDYTFSDGSATSPGNYTAVNGTLNWADGDAAPKTIAVPLINDTVLNSTRAFYVQLANPGGGALIADSPYDQTVVAIHDDDAVAAASVLDFTQTQVRVDENAGQVQLTVTRTGSAVGAVLLPYVVLPGSAQAGSDYVDVSGALAWADGDGTAKTITVHILDDAVPEGLESFRVLISAPSGNATVGANNQATVIIVDDDAASAGTLHFTTAAVSAAEDAGSIVFSVTRDGGTSGAVTVSCATFVDSTVDNGRPSIDFVPTVATLAWAAGDASPKTFTVPLIADHQPGIDRTFQVRLSSPTGGALLDSAHGLPTATATITESDPAPAGILGFSATTFAADENAGSALVTVSRRGGSTGAVSLHYVSTALTALDGIDFTPVDGRLSWADGDAADKTISVPLLDDALVEGDETFYLFLDEPTGGALIGTPNATVTIRDDEVNPAGQLQFAAATVTVDTAAGTVLVHVSRSGGASGAVTVPYVITDVTATSGVDYIATSNGVLSWSAGDSADQTIAIAVLPRAHGSGTRTARVTLGAPTGGATLGLAAEEFDIVDPTPVADGGSRRRCGRGHFFSLVLLGLLGLWWRGRRW